MFVNYMPFLLLGFMAIEDYFEGKRKYMVTLWAFLMLMTSYFFAVSGLAAMAVYGVYRWLKSQLSRSSAKTEQHSLSGLS